MLLLTKAYDPRRMGGREKLSKLNLGLLSDIFQDRLKVLELEFKPVSSAGEVGNAFRGFIDGLSPGSISQASALVQKHRIHQVFIDGSNFGEFARAIKESKPGIEVTTFFHNVEARFFWGAVKASKSVRSIGVMLANYLAERKAVKYSDNIICLNERDSRLLERTYGRCATHIAPMSMDDRYEDIEDRSDRAAMCNYALFVGGDFYANSRGAAWFAENVAPFLDLKTVLVGRGLEKYRGELEAHDKVEVIGEVESLARWYRDANFVVAPIFDGSGMKTKVAEALMHGKKIIGTKDAFTGYEAIIDQAGFVCETAEDFIDAASRIEVRGNFDRGLREIFEQNFSYGAAKARLQRILCA